MLTDITTTRSTAVIALDGATVCFMAQDNLDALADRWMHQAAASGTYDAVTHATLAALVLGAAELDAEAIQHQAAGSDAEAAELRRERHRLVTAALALMHI